jgi:large repetitive protein
VKFGSALATNVTVVSATKITATSPAHATGLVDVHLTTPSGTSAITTNDHYTYT